MYILGTAGDNPFVEEATGKRNVDDIMIQKGNEKIYYLSDKSEKGLVSGLAWKAFGGIFGGAALSVVCLLIILFYLTVEFGINLF